MGESKRKWNENAREGEPEIKMMIASEQSLIRNL
jgi:hypothetical protein